MRMKGIGSINREALKEAMKVVKTDVEGYFVERLMRVCDALVEDAVKSKEYRNLTGNTVTSYTCGLFVNGSLRYVSRSGDGMPSPVRMKLGKGEKHFFDPDYDGARRFATGTVETDGGYGSDSAMSFLQGYKTRRKGFAIVMTTGTEYSTYLEEEHDLNVLTDTFQRAREVLFNQVKTMND